MHTQKHIQFTNLIKAGGQLHEFNFRRSMGTDGPVFTVDVADPKGERHYVVFGFDGKHWLLKTQTLPAWIEDVLPQIQNLISAQV